MLTTYTASHYKSWALDRLGDQSFDDNQLSQYLQDVVREICHAHPWSFLEKVFEGTVTAGQIYYDLQASITDFQVPISLQLVDPDGNAIPMEYWPYQRFDKTYPDPTALTEATPNIWTMLGTTLVIGPAPADDDYTFRLLYLKEGDTLFVDTDTAPDIPDAFREVIVLGMVSRALYANDQYDEAQVMAQEFELKLDKMIKRLGQRQLGQPDQMGSGRQDYPDWITW